MQGCSWVRDEMKCRFCGGIVNLTDSVCPHCGKENPLGKKYNADMKKYQERTDAADARVMTSQSYTAKVYVRGIYIIILLAVFLGLAVYMTVSGKEFAKKQKKAAQNYDKVVEKLDRYWNYKDYIAKYLASDNIYDKNRALSDACSLLAEFYDYNNLHYIYGKPAYGEDSDTKVREIHDDMCLILKTYFYINDEESENIKNMSRSQIQTVIEDSINRHDSQGDIK